MVNYAVEGQLSIFDWLEPEPVKIEPVFKKGDKIYKLTLDIVEIGTIDRTWELGDRHGYSAKKESGIYMTFWTENIGDTVFSSKKKVYSKAEGLRNEYRVIRVSDLEIVEERDFVEVCTDSRICISATAKLLKGNIVYSKEWFCYPFLELFKSESEAEKRYKDVLEKIISGVDEIKRFEVKATVEMQDMYLSKTKKWSNYAYTDFHIPVLMQGLGG